MHYYIGFERIRLELFSKVLHIFLNLILTLSSHNTQLN